MILVNFGLDFGFRFGSRQHKKALLETGIFGCDARGRLFSVPLAVFAHKQLGWIIFYKTYILPHTMKKKAIATKPFILILPLRLVWF